MHFSLSSWLTNQVEHIEAKAENQSSATSPGQSMEARGTTEIPSSLPRGKSKAQKQDVPRQTLQAFFDFCKSAPYDLPHSLFGDNTCPCNVLTSQAMRQFLICSLQRRLTRMGQEGQGETGRVRKILAWKERSGEPEGNEKNEEILARTGRVRRARERQAGSG